MKRRFTLLFITIILIISILIGCSGHTLEVGKQDKTDYPDITDNIEVNRDEFEIVDMAGRKVSISANVERVFSTVPTGTIILYSLCQDKMIGWNYTLKNGEKRYIDQSYHDLPDLGGASKSSINLEELLKEKPDVLIEMTGINEESINKADQLQAKLNIPVVIVDEDINKLDDVYSLLGEILGEREKSIKLSNYIKDVLDQVKLHKETSQDHKRVNVYYAEGPRGLETEPSGSWHAELIDMVGGRNVAQVDISQIKGKSEVSMEQIISWDPDIIISWDDERGGYYSGILSDPIWKDIKAVKNKQVYEIVNKPFNWFDRPPSVNRILGIQWLGNLLYPEIYDYDMRDVVREFYSDFYHYDLNEEELDEILINTIN